MASSVVETQRLVLDIPTTSDSADLFPILGDKQAMRYTLQLSSLEETESYIAERENRRGDLNFAPWTIRLKADGRTIGYGGLYVDAIETGWGPEVIYFFAKDVWNQGFATELVKHCVHHARHGLVLSQLSAFAHRDNIASQRVLEKAGFTVGRFIERMDRLLYIHKLLDN